MKELVVMGNGFDLSCGLASKYDDFFRWRIKKLFHTTDFDNIRKKLEEKCKSVTKSKPSTVSGMTVKTAKKYQDYWSRIKQSKIVNNQQKGPDYKDYYLEYGLDKKFPGLTRWDVFFIYAEKYLKDSGYHEWENIENLINNIVEIALANQEYSFLEKSVNEIPTNLPYQKNEKEIFEAVVHKFANVGSSNPEKIALVLLNELIKFEKVFAKYINLQIFSDQGKNSNFFLPYFLNAKQLIKEITGFENSGNHNNGFEINVLSFNYTLGPRFQNQLNDEMRKNEFHIKSWNNIHGLACYNDSDAKNAIKHNGDLPAPIFGVDRDNVLHFGKNNGNSARVVFTKPYRLIVNKIKNIRQNVSFENTDKIIIYGHSLGQADYSYFEYIFDQCNIYNENINIIFYYWPGESAGQDKVNEQEEERKYTEKVVELLSHYGYISDKANKNIVTKLAVEGRLSVLPDPQIYGYEKVDLID